MKALVALDHREQIAASHRVAEPLVDRAHDTGEARHHVCERIFVRRDAAVQDDALADRGGRGAGDRDPGGLDLLGCERHTVLVRREPEAMLAPALARHDLRVEGVRLVDRLVSQQILAAWREADAIGAVSEPLKCHLELDARRIDRLLVLVDERTKFGWNALLEDRELERELAVFEPAAPLRAALEGRLLGVLLFLVGVFVARTSDRPRQRHAERKRYQ